MARSWTAPLLMAGLAAALPQGTPVAPSPSGQDCTWHEDHWDCLAPCETVTTTRLAIDATVTDWDAFRSSMDAEHSTSDVPFTGSSVFVHTSLYTYPGGSFTGYQLYDSHALTRAGFSITTELVAETSCPTTFTLPPSPTGANCSPHQDHCK
ncbi:hypothetical protein VdG1_01616 [Verticillium dahliae VDG1]|nr:hypothetical protein VdG1_01616 [Verticillium dahliae VDG1]